MITPEFDRRASIVFGSPYWDVPGRRSEEWKTLKDAIIDGSADTYDELPDEAKAIFDRAEAAQREYDEKLANAEGWERFTVSPGPGTVGPAPPGWGTIPAEAEGEA